MAATAAQRKQSVLLVLTRKQQLAELDVEAAKIYFEDMARLARTICFQSKFEILRHEFDC
jgi:hypothetical protein